MRFIDTHAHLNLPEFKKDLSEVVERARLSGIIKCIVVGIDKKTGIKALEVKRAFPDFVEIALGFHPHEVKKLTEEDYLWLERELEQAVALGEVGLDWVKEYSPKELQISHLERLLELARRYRKPVILHLRGDLPFWDLAFDLLKAHQDLPLLFHCFTSEKEVAFKALDFNSMISLPGVITFDKAKTLQEAVKFIPLERLVLETDCPYLAPTPMRGKRNEPAFLRYTALKLAEIKGMSLKEVAHITTQNAIKFFNLQPPILDF